MCVHVTVCECVCVRLAAFLQVYLSVSVSVPVSVPVLVCVVPQVSDFCLWSEGLLIVEFILRREDSEKNCEIKKRGE